MKMKLNLKKILFRHYLDTGEYITQTEIAREIVKLGLYKNEHTAQNMIQRWTAGTYDTPAEVLKYLSERFGKTINDLMI